MSQPKEQILLRFDPEIVSLLKMRAKILNKSVNSHILALVLKDLQEVEDFPKVSVPENLDMDLMVMAGDGSIMPSQEDLDEDERLAAIWRR